MKIRQDVKEKHLSCKTWKDKNKIPSENRQEKLYDNNQ